jgi:hypothetical protein
VKGSRDSKAPTVAEVFFFFEVLFFGAGDSASSSAAAELFLETVGAAPWEAAADSPEPNKLCRKRKRPPPTSARRITPPATIRINFLLLAGFTSVVAGVAFSDI